MHKQDRASIEQVSGVDIPKNAKIRLPRAAAFQRGTGGKSITQSEPNEIRVQTYLVAVPQGLPR